MPRERILEHFERHLRAVEAAGGGKPVLVCHSLGGLLARKFLRVPDNACRVGAVITLGTPHRGSKVAALAPGKLGQSIRPDSDFMRELWDGVPPSHEHAGALLTPQDATRNQGASHPFDQEPIPEARADNDPAVVGACAPPLLAALASPVDEAVLPPLGLVPPDGWKLRITPPVGHFSMLFRPGVADMVLEELDLVDNPGASSENAPQGSKEAESGTADG